MLEVAKAIANDFMNLVRDVMLGDVGINGKVMFNTLERSDIIRQMQTRASANGDIVVELLLNHYIVYIEHGRRAGAKYPPVEPILRWMKKNGIPTDNGTLWKIMHSIVERGIAPRPIMATAFDIIDKEYSDKWMDMVFDELVKLLDEAFD